EDGAQPLDLDRELGVLARQLLALEAGEAGEAHLEDRLGLPLGEEIVHALVGLEALGLGPAGAAEELAEAMERELEQVLPCVLGVAAGADGGDHPLDVAGGHAQALDQLPLRL